MNVVVCLKQILDPEIPQSDFRLNAEKSRASDCGSQVISIFDENALEVAIQLRDRNGDVKITALSLGSPQAIDVLRKALSMRADDAVLLRQQDFPVLDEYATARVLSAAVRKLQPVDAVFCGRETGDWHGGLVAGFLASELSWPYVAFVAEARKQNSALRLRRQVDDGWEIVESSTPVVVSVTNDSCNLPRIPKVKDNVMAFRREIPVWTAPMLGLDPATVAGPNAELEKRPLQVPVVDRRCEPVAGQTAEESARAVVQRLADWRVI